MTLDGLARLPARERSDLFAATAVAVGLPATYVEKDFWVCWTLNRLFGLNHGVALTFKGGTSLSKAFAAIHRFSEDIDLALDYHDLGFKDERDPLVAERKKVEKLVKRIRSKSRHHVREQILPALSAAIADALGENGWSLTQDPDPLISSLFFAYPKSDSSMKAGRVLLEFGARGKSKPSKSREITPYVATQFPSRFTLPHCSVPVLDIEVTMWEKVTILHANHFAEKLREHSFRDYSDVAQLADMDCGRCASQDRARLADVVRHKETLFPAIGYDTAKHGSLRLVPPEKWATDLRRDYESMKDMYHTKIPTFEGVIERLRIFESELNGVQ